MASVSSVDKLFFGPLDSRYCLLFYSFSIVGFLLFCRVLVGTITGLFMKQKKKVSFLEISFTIYVLIMLFMMYFQNRLLYSMCVKSTSQNS